MDDKLKVETSSRHWAHSNLRLALSLRVNLDMEKYANGVQKVLASKEISKWE